MKKKVLILATVFTLLASVSYGSGLDRTTFKKYLSERIENSITQRASNTNFEIKPSNVNIKKVVPASVTIDNADLNLYAVKARIKISEKSEGFPIKTIVDDSGKLQVTIKNMDTNENVFQKAIDKINKIEIPDNLGKIIYPNNQDPYAKGHEIVIVADPFNRYCEKALDYLLNNKNKISSIRMIQLPNHVNFGSDAVIWAVREGLSQTNINSLKLVRFAYKDVKPVNKGSLKKKREEIIKQFMNEFYAFDAKWKSAEKARYHLKGKYQKQLRIQKIKAVNTLDLRIMPRIYIDGIPIDGWDKVHVKSLF